MAKRPALAYAQPRDWFAPSSREGSPITTPAGVLATKLVVPSPRPNLVPRPRLIDQITAGVRGRLTLLAAPAGFGKSTLLSAWCASDQGRVMPHAWVSLDVTDADPSRFWVHVVAAADRLCPGAGELPLALLTAPERPGMEVVLGSLVNGLASIERDVVLILDDYHLVDTTDARAPRNAHAAAAVHAGLGFLLDHLPPQVHVVISTRADPPLALARLRARGELVELRAADLKFELEEVRAFFDQTMALSLAEGDAAALELRTEGWIAGLQLAGLALRHQATAADRAAFVAEFTGSDRFVVDYLAEEVLQHQSPAIQDFLLRTSILDRLSGQLCDAMLADRAEQSESQAVLEALERASLFVVPLDRERRWYRYHHLFADVLRARLQAAATGAEIADLHRRASDWFAAHGQPTEAIGHALAGGDFERAVVLIEDSWTDGLAAGLNHLATIERWLAVLPAALVRSSPALCFFRAAPLVGLSGIDLAGAETWLTAGERALAASGASRNPTPSDVASELAWARALLAATRGDADGALVAGRAALDGLHPSNVAGRCYAAMALSSAHLMRGELTRAEAMLADAVTLARTVGDTTHANQTACSLSYVQRTRGALREAAETCAAGLAWSAQRGPAGRVDQGTLLASLADLHRERNELGAALRWATEAATASQRWGTPDQVALATLVLARVRQAHGDTVGALRALDDLATLEAHVVWLVGIVAAFRAQLRPPAAAELARSRELPLRSRARLLPYLYEHMWIAPVQLLLARGDRSSVRLGLAELDALEPEAVRLPWLRIKILALRALAHHALGDAPAALGALHEAVELGEPEGYVRVFADEGPPLVPLLRTLRGQVRQTDYVDRLLSAISTPQRPPSDAPAVIEQLSGRELEVLRLIAGGRSNAQIARELIIATSTVKTHVNSVFAKLGVASRTQAIARARDLDLV